MYRVVVLFFMLVQFIINYSTVCYNKQYALINITAEYYAVQ